MATKEMQRPVGKRLEIEGVAEVATEQARIDAERVAREEAERVAREEVERVKTEVTTVNEAAIKRLADGVRQFRAEARNRYNRVVERKAAALREFLAADAAERELIQESHATVARTRKSLRGIVLPPEWQVIRGGHRVERKRLELGSMKTWEGDVAVSDPVERIKLDTPDTALVRRFLDEGGIGIPTPSTNPLQFHVQAHRVAEWLKTAREAGHNV